MTQPSKCPACHKEFKNLKAHLRRKTPCIKEEKEVDELASSLEKLSIQKYQKPLLKWVGGKTQLLDSIVPLIPQSIENYYEPFVGGGSVLFAVLTLVNEGKIKINNTINAYDSNAKLIEFYTSVQQKPQELYDTIRVLSDTYNSINTLNGNRKPDNEEEAKTSKESYYYYSRKIFNHETTSINRAALFIFLNKTCFRGVYRESPKSGFNVPFGNYSSTINIVTKEEIMKVNSLIKDVIFKTQDFQELNTKSTQDFVYFDPPYYPLKSKKSFLVANSIKQITSTNPILNPIS